MYSKILPDADDTDDEDDDAADVEPTGTLLVGDSLLRDVVATDDTLTVDSTGGAQINTVCKKLGTINPRRKKYDTIITVIGTNDASTKKAPEKICSEFKALLAVVQPLASNVVVSSIPPRDDARVDPGKIDKINQLLVPILNDAGVRFVNNDTNFRYRDNSLDSSLLLADKLHLSSAGVNKLLLNLGISDKAKARQALRPDKRRQYPTPRTNYQQHPTPLMQVPTSAPPRSSTQDRPVLFHGARSPLSNFFPFPMNIWNLSFKSSEHAYQYRKCIHMNNNTAAADVLKAEIASQAKWIGDSIGVSQSWKDIQTTTMMEILRVKSRQCPQFVRALVNSNSRPLIEDTPNEFWGRGPNGRGQNTLGKLLTTLRTELSSNRFTPHPTVAPPRSHTGHSSPRQSSQQLRCFNCGEASHTVDTCGLSRPLRCYQCNGTGHKKKFCPKSRSNPY